MTVENTALLALNDIHFHWQEKQKFFLNIETFSLQKGERVLLLGESGSGKSTLLSLICGTILPEQGQVNIKGTTINHLSGARRDRFRAEHIGIIFQQFNLLPFGSVADNILLPLQFTVKRKAQLDNPLDEARRLCLSLGLDEQIMNVKASHLSVGQQQRVAVARALIGKPDLIIADEPTSALDTENQDVFLHVMFDQVQQSEATLLMVSHDRSLAHRFDRAVELSDLISQKDKRADKQADERADEQSGEKAEDISGKAEMI